ncbi:hypothetical protein D3C85_1336150 [compost metagenome]
MPLPMHRTEVKIIASTGVEPSDLALAKVITKTLGPIHFQILLITIINITIVRTITEEPTSEWVLIGTLTKSRTSKRRPVIQKITVKV